MFTRLKKYGIDGFVVALLIAILVAWLFPYFSTINRPISLNVLTNWGIAGIFFFYGLRLSPASIREGTSNWKLHLLIQITTFILFPLLILAVMAFFPNAKSDLLWLGIFYVAALPSTVSSSVVMVSIARGNIPSAIFNASLSSLLGVFITPLWLRFFSENEIHGAAGFSDILTKLFLQVILPIIIGILLHRPLGKYADRYGKFLRFFERAVIVLIVYNAFANSFTDGIFSGYGIEIILWVIAGMGLLFTVIYLIMLLACRWMHFSTEDTITATFCGSKKSLVHGSAMSKILFPHISSSGLILMPVMIYHILQLIIVSIIATRLSRREDSNKNKGV